MPKKNNKIQNLLKNTHNRRHENLLNDLWDVFEVHTYKTFTCW